MAFQIQDNFIQYKKLDNLNRLISTIKNGIETEKIYNMYIQSPPELNIKVLNDFNKISHILYTFLEINNYDYLNISSKNSMGRVIRYIIRAYEDGYCTEFNIDINELITKPYILVCVILSPTSKNKFHDMQVYGKIHNYFNENKQICDYYGDVHMCSKPSEFSLPKLRPLSYMITEITNNLKLPYIATTNDLQIVLSFVCRYSIIKENSLELYKNNVLDLLNNIIQDYDQEFLFVPALIAMNNIMRNIGIEELNNSCNILCQIKKNVSYIFDTYNSTNSTFYKNAIIFSGSIMNLYY